MGIIFQSNVNDFIDQVLYNMAYNALDHQKSICAQGEDHDSSSLGSGGNDSLDSGGRSPADTMLGSESHVEVTDLKKFQDPDQGKLFVTTPFNFLHFLNRWTIEQGRS